MKTKLFTIAIICGMFLNFDSKTYSQCLCTSYTNITTALGDDFEVLLDPGSNLDDIAWDIEPLELDADPATNEG